jgi:hypothetical protein
VFKKIAILVLALGLPIQVLAQAEFEPEDELDYPSNFPQRVSYGVIQSLDFGQSMMVVDGNRYRVAADVNVEIGGTYGAFTMLQTGMRIRLEYLVVSPSSREIIDIREMPPGFDIEPV